MGPGWRAEFICGISAICGSLWNNRDAGLSTGTIAIPRLAFGSLGMTIRGQSRRRSETRIDTTM
jgi:hypothetical protein